MHASARRGGGELPLRLPAGYVMSSEGAVVLDPDQEVQGAIHTIFMQVEHLGTATAVLHCFNAHGLRIPRRRWHAHGDSQLIWMRPSYQAIHSVLSTPAYAGAYVYGRRGPAPRGPVGLEQPSGR